MHERLIRTFVVAAALSGCSPSPSATPTAAMVVEATLSATNPASPRPSVSPSASPIPFLEDDDLANVSLDKADVTAVCDPDPSGGDAAIFCYDGLQWGFRALRTVMPSVDRLYLHRPGCATTACTSDELGEAAVIGWADGHVYTVLISYQSGITVPLAGATAEWPVASSSIPPMVARPMIDGAPAEVRRRAPYPYCGREKPVGLVTDEPGDYERVLEINRCFIDGVLEGRPVEMVLVTAVTRELVVLRFDGMGFVVRYMQEGSGPARAWYRREGSLILGSSVFWGLDGPFEPIKLD